MSSPLTDPKLAESVLANFGEARELARVLMAKLYEIRGKCPCSEFPDLWHHIPMAQTTLQKVMDELSLAHQEVVAKTLGPT